MTTLQDVARRAGVSIATVSKVLSNTPYFTEETRDKVMLAVNELGYVPHLGGRALSSGKTHIIAAVFPYVYEAIFQDPLVMQILGGVEAECTAHGYNLLLSTPRLNADGPEMHYKQLIKSGYIDGVLAIDNVPKASVAQEAIERNIPTIVLGYHHSECYVRSDDYSGGMQLMEHILSLGHREIGIITVQQEMNFAVNERVRGLRDVATNAGLDFAALPAAYTNYSTTGGAQAAQTLLDHHPDLTAMICLNDRNAMGAIQHIKRIGRRVPDEISVVGYDNISISEIFYPAITTIDQQASETGRIGANLLFELLGGNKPTPVVLPTHLIVRETSAARC